MGEGKNFKCLSSENMRDLIDFMNDNFINQEDIVSIFADKNNKYWLVYNK